MTTERGGTWVVSSTVGETIRAFLPSPLPPSPPLDLGASDYDLLDRANRAIGRLDGSLAVLPGTSLFVYMYVRKEALLSSQIEGTQSSMSDLLLHEVSGAPGVPMNGVLEVSNYVAAMQHGLDRMRGGFPLSLRLIREIHEVLLRDGRGSTQSPGEFRVSQNWIGGSRPGNATYVPPPSDRLMACLDPFEKFLHDQPQRTPLLIKAALAHAQFESIHPFLDGNGRLGRLLITLLLCTDFGPKLTGARFSKQAVDTARRLLAMFEADRSLRAVTPTRAHGLFGSRPVDRPGHVARTHRQAARPAVHLRPLRRHPLRRSGAAGGMTGGDENPGRLQPTRKLGGTRSMA